MPDRDGQKNLAGIEIHDGIWETTEDTAAIAPFKLRCSVGICHNKSSSLLKLRDQIRPEAKLLSVVPPPCCGEFQCRLAREDDRLQFASRKSSRSCKETPAAGLSRYSATR